MRQNGVWVWAVALLVALCGGLPAAWATTINSLSPQGEVAAVRQVTVRFSEAVVPLGDPRLPDPVTLQCTGNPPAGSSRWADEKTWVFDYREALPPGVRCSITLRSGWKPLTAASALSGRSAFSFSTGGPAVVSSVPWDGAQIDEDQHFLLQLTGPAVAATVASQAWCEVEGIGERQAVLVVDGAAREAVLKARKTPPARAARSLLLRCPRPLPSAAAVRLVWGRGIASTTDPQVLTTAVQTFNFQVRPAFTAEFSCERERAEAPCLPISTMSLRFSAPVPRALAAQVRLKPASGAALAPQFDKDDHAPEVNELRFPLPLPENTRFSIELPKGLKDSTDRPLANAASYPLAVATGGAPPLAKLAAAPFGIIESADPVLPLTLRHVQSDLRLPAGQTAPGGVRVKRVDGDAEMLRWYQQLQKYHETSFTAEEAGLPKAQWKVVERDQDARGRVIERLVDRQVGSRELSLLKALPEVRRLDLPQLQGGDPRPFEVVGIPLGEPGYHVVEIESPRLGQALLDKAAPMYVRSGVLVTNLGVHFKLGRENSLVWVTTLDRGRPVAGAEVAVLDCLGKRVWNGQTDAQGLSRIRLALDPNLGECPGEPGYFVTARRVVPEGEHRGKTDVSFVFTNWQKGIETWRFNHPTGQGPEPEMRVHTVFDRSLLRAGETVSMKHFVRLETSAGLSTVPTAQLPTRVKLVHQGSGQEVVLPLTWRGGRSALSTWKIPPSAKLGSYEVLLEREGASNGRGRSSWTSGDFRVEEFRVPLVDARLSGPKTIPVAPTELPLALQLNYLSGGRHGRSAGARQRLAETPLPEL